MNVGIGVESSFVVHAHGRRVLVATALWMAAGIAAAAVPASAVAATANQAIQRATADLGYGPEVGDAFVAFAARLSCEAWKKSVEKARSEGVARGDPAAASRVEIRVIDDIRVRLDAIVRRTTGDSPYWDLPRVLADRKTQCLGHCQLWYVIGTAAGLEVAAVEVTRPATGELPEHETHVAPVVRLSDKRVRMLDSGFAVDVTAFHFNEVYRRNGLFWNRNDLAGHRTLPRRVRPLGRAAIEAAILLNIGNTYSRAGQEVEAGKIYERGLALDPGSTALRLAVGETSLRTGRGDEAESAIREAIGGDPESSAAHAALGRLHARAGRWQAAVDAFDQALALKPNSPDVRRRRREALERTSRP